MIFRVKTLLAFFTLVFSTFNISKAQTPTTCFEIESILVDACGSPEGENEMVRFIVGPNNLNVTNLTVNWPNNSFQGICQNATTASKVATLNSTILGCGLLLEPTANILPAGASVIFITSTAFNTSANSFANLNDTMYVIFQCAGNTSGHFANYSASPGIRTLSMTFSPPVGCTDMVSYDRTILINQNGIIGGSSAIRNGASVNFAWNGTPTYVNDSCTAPIKIDTVAINTSFITICPGDTVSLSGSIYGNFQSVNWGGGQGTYSSANDTITNYFSSVLDNSNFYIYFEGITTCGDTLRDSILVQIGTNTASVNITAPTTELCAGDSILLTANGTGNYLWNNSSSSNTIYVNTAGTYSVTSSTGCGSDMDSITITTASTISVSLTADSTTICQGGISNLTATGAPNYTWFNSTTGTTTTANTSGNYYVIGYNNCYQDSQSINITVIPIPTINVSSNMNTLCNGDSATLTASGATNYLWNTSDTTAQIVVTSAGTYTVSTSNSCFTVQDSVVIGAGVSPNAVIVGDTVLCDNSLQLSASGGNTYLWSTGGTDSTEIINTGGSFYVIASNGCGSDTAYHNVTNYGVTASFISNYQPNSNTPVQVDFINTSTNATNYNWSFGDGNTSTLTNPSNTYTVQGNYNVVLTASNQFCSATYEVTLNIESLNTVYIPNIFTPNGDGMNDVFMIKGDNLVSAQGRIFNRWGKNIYTWDGVNRSWDGTYEGKLVPDGTYFYLIKVTWLNAESEELKGSITKLK